MDECTAALASLTFAIKAQHALTDAGISAKVTKLSPDVAKRGCEYGISYPCEHQSEVKANLRANGIGVRRFLKGGGETI